MKKALKKQYVLSLQYVEYAVECRRRVKEQMNKRKPDDEFAKIDLSYFNHKGEEIIVSCPESIGAMATLAPNKTNKLADEDESAAVGSSHMNTETVAESDSLFSPAVNVESVTGQSVVPAQEKESKEQHFKINYGATGYSYESIISPYLIKAKSVVIEDPYIRAKHQLNNFVRFCEALLKQPSIEKITLITSYDDQTNIQEMAESLKDLQQSLLELDVELDVKVNENLHDREINIDNGWTVKIGRGLDFYQKPDSWFGVGVNDLSLRKCLETSVDIFKK
jgi:ATP-dependent Lon protease